MTETTVICDTEGCTNYGIPITVEDVENEPWSGVICGGGCGGQLHFGNEIEPIMEPSLEDKIAQAVEAALRSHGLID